MIFVFASTIYDISSCELFHFFAIIEAFFCPPKFLNDFKLEESYLEIYAIPENFDLLRSAMEERGVKINTAELSMVPKSTVSVDQKTAEQTLKLLDKLEELDDVQKVYTNADFPDDVLEQYKA